MQFRVGRPRALLLLIWPVAPLLAAAVLRAAIAATPSNASSPLGINLAGVAYYSPEQPFLNVFVTNGGWTTHARTTWDTGEERYLQLDADGYPTTLTASPSDPHSPQLFDSVGVVLERQGGRYLYPGGQYVVLYEGNGKLRYGFDAKLLRSSPGRDVIEVTPSDAGIDLEIVKTDPHDPIRDIRLVRRQNEAALESGRLFEPAFLDLLKRFRVLRFMDWLQTNGSTLSSWSDRPVPSYYSWGTRGVPLEVAVSLANAVSADPWLNVPAAADDHYIRQMAELVHRRLGPMQKVYVEYSNEVWNGAFSQYGYAATRGRALWPNRPSGGDDYEWNRNWYGMRTAQMCDIWKSEWGADRDRVICVLGAQAAFTYSATDSLDCSYWTAGAPCSRHGIGAVAIAPYFGDGTMPSQWATQPDGALALLFGSLGSPNEADGSPVMEWVGRLRAKLARHHLIAPTPDTGIPVGGWFHQVAQWETSYEASLARYHLPLIAYEGGEGFVGGGNEAGTSLFIAANRDPRMGTAYEEYLQQWKANGGELFVLYNDVTSFSQYGEWGALESLLQLQVSPPASLPPKWRAIQHFIGSTPCWWPGCAAGGAANDGLTSSSSR